MSKKETKPKKTVRLKCPCCKKGIIVEHYKEQVQKGVAAEYNEWSKAKKDTQAPLDLSGTAGKDKKKTKTTTTKKKRTIKGREPHQDALV